MEMESLVELSKCQGCKKILPDDAFIKGNKSYKRCEKCRQKRVKTPGYKQICLHPDCGIRAVFNYESETKGIRCCKHKEPGMINVVNKKCAHTACNKTPSFNYQSESKAKFCAVHKEIGMVDVRSKKCAHVGCMKGPSFNHPSELGAKFCVEHKEVGMIDVKSRKCALCSKAASYNFEGKTRGKFCADHREIGMIDMKNKKCAHAECGKMASFNIESESKGKFCATHKEMGMVDVKHKKCAYVGCSKRPHFGHAKSRAVFCVDHKETAMINVAGKKYTSEETRKITIRRRKCEHAQCGKISTFNFQSERKGRFCIDHKETGMVDVMHDKCTHSGCNTRTRYGFPGMKPSVCAKHKTEGMCMKPLSRCQEDDCKEKAIYGITIPIHCEEHHVSPEENLCLRICKNKACSRLEICNDEGLCLEYCINSNLFNRSKNQKEIRVRNLLKREIQEQPHSHDKIVDSTCNKKRPDILYDCKTHFLAIEIDEHQHSSYQAECETTRMKEICQAIGMPAIFIRYNPDNYTDSQSKKSKIPKAKREQILVEWVRHSMKSAPKSTDEFLRTVYLFYNGYEPTNSSFDCIKMI